MAIFTENVDSSLFSITQPDSYQNFDPYENFHEVAIEEFDDEYEDILWEYFDSEKYDDFLAECFIESFNEFTPDWINATNPKAFPHKGWQLGGCGFDLDINEDEYNDLYEELTTGEEKDKFEEWLRERWSSRDGFISDMANNLAALDGQERWRTVAQIIDYKFFVNGPHGEDGFDYNFLYRVMENGYLYDFCDGEYDGVSFDDFYRLHNRTSEEYTVTDDEGNETQPNFDPMRGEPMLPFDDDRLKEGVDKNGYLSSPDIVSDTSLPKGGTDKFSKYRKVSDGPVVNGTAFYEGCGGGSSDDDDDKEHLKESMERSYKDEKLEVPDYDDLEVIRFDNDPTNEGVSVRIRDNKNKLSFWFDLWISEDNDIEGDWNAYIFHLDNSKDVRQKTYQENADTYEIAYETAYQAAVDKGFFTRDNGDCVSYSGGKLPGGAVDK